MTGAIIGSSTEKIYEELGIKSIKPVKSIKSIKIFHNTLKNKTPLCRLYVIPL